MLSIINNQKLRLSQPGPKLALRDLCERISHGLQFQGLNQTHPNGLTESLDDSLLCRMLLVQLSELSLFSPGLNSFSQMCDYLQLDKIYQRWLKHSLRLLVEQHFLERSADHYQLAASVTVENVKAEWHSAVQRWLQHDELAAQARLVDCMLQSLPKILTAQTPATDVMFPESSMHLVEGIYRQNRITDGFNHVVRDMIIEGMQSILKQDPNYAFRLFEIGAGTGGNSASILSGLQPFGANVAEYCYTDISKSFLMNAEEVFGAQHPFLRFQLFDVESPPGSVKKGQYDVVIATNVLHATKDIGKTLRNVKSLLKQNGYLIINELSAFSVFTHLTFGMLEGWWLYEDDDIRIPGCPGLSAESWEKAMRQEGFGPIVFPATRFHEYGHQIIAAQSDGVCRESSIDQSLSRKEQGMALPAGAGVVNEQVIKENAGTAISIKSPEKETDELGQLQTRLIQLVALLTKMDATEISPDESFRDFGVDSILGIKLIHEINQSLELDLETTDLFDYGSIERLACYIVESGKIATQPEPRVHKTVSPPANGAEKSTEPLAEPVREVTIAPAQSAAIDSPRMTKEPIAIVGMSGRFGNSPDLNSLWQQLVAGDDLIVPVARWDLHSINERGASFCNAGSFIEDIDLFDPIFFKMSGLEAAFMDPQQRLFLEESWHALENAGYAGESTIQQKCGVYVGCQDSGYSQLMGEHSPPSAMWGNALSALPARISYFLDLQGPAVSIDTACSSSLVAVHMACQALWGQEVDMALAGGVSLQCTPQFYLIASKAGMLSPEGKCFTFDDRANGFVPGEGVGVVVLRRLKDALDSRDHIYATIEASGINQDGNSNGITAPSSRSQERLMRSVYQDFQINPENIDMIEAHGTGTTLGDPIEFRALNAVFGSQQRQAPHCALGSIKANLGHTIAMAGLAGLFRVVLSMENEMIPPAINFRRANAKVPLDGSPFYINTSARAWPRNARRRRLGAVSSFGVSGTNAHAVLAEPPVHGLMDHETRPLYLIPLSSGSEESLKRHAHQMLQFCRTRHPALSNLAYSLFVGRRHLTYRLSIIAGSTDEFCDKLEQWLELGHSKSVFTGNTEERVTAEQNAQCQMWVSEVAGTPPMQSTHKLLESIAKAFTKGAQVRVQSLFAIPGRSMGHSKLPLPGQVFDRSRYWLPDPAADLNQPNNPDLPKRHSLLQRHCSTDKVQQFTGSFNSGHFFLSDHRVQGKCILPGVVSLEMAAVAVAAGFKKTNCEDRPSQSSAKVRLRNTAWSAPFIATVEDQELTVELQSISDCEVGYSIFSLDSDSSGSVKRVKHCEGVGSYASAVLPQNLDLPSIRLQCGDRVISGAVCYQLYKEMGFEYGPAHRCIQELTVGQGGTLARLALPSTMLATLAEYDLHPGLVDCALQASIGMARDLVIGNSGSVGAPPSLPFALDELTVFGKCVSPMWAWLRFSSGYSGCEAVWKLDVDLCTDSGEVIAELRGLSFRELKSVNRDASSMGDVQSQSANLYQSEWVPQMLPDGLVPIRALNECWFGLLGLPQVDAEESISLIGARHRLTTERSPCDENFVELTSQLIIKIQHEIRNIDRDLSHYILAIEAGTDFLTSQGLVAVLKTLQQENPSISGQLIVMDGKQSSAQLIAQLQQEAQCGNSAEVSYQSGQRCVKRLSKKTTVQPASKTMPLIAWKENGVYLISGGMGGVARHFVSDIAKQLARATVILLGRSYLDAQRRAQIEALQQANLTITYVQVDVSNDAEVALVIDDVLADYGRIDGVVQAAGIVDDQFILRKDASSIGRVLAPKVNGTLNLDKHTQQLPLDFFCTFSGLAGVFGNAGQADYAAACAFQDALMEKRSLLQQQGQRSGRSLSINWPYWRQGGMAVSPIQQQQMSEALGIEPLKTSTGLSAFHAALALESSQVLVLCGDLPHIHQLITKQTQPDREAVSATLTSDSKMFAVTDAEAQTETYLIELLAKNLNLNSSRIRATSPLDEYGIDSVVALTLTAELEKSFGSLSKTLLFEHTTIKSLAQHFLAKHRPKMLSIIAESQVTPPKTIEQSVFSSVEEAHLSAEDFKKDIEKNIETVPKERQSIASVDGFAIVGMAARFACANDIDEFEQCLAENRDCITRIDRQQWQEYLAQGDQLSPVNRPTVRWGAFIENSDAFDASFFTILPQEAAIMDPQARLFLECTWHLLEDACYTRERIHQQLHNQVAVYVGAMYQHHQLQSSSLAEDSIRSVVSLSSIANRVSHYFDFNGPSMTIDSTCSSSLVALHLACTELAHGQSRMAIVGGVNLSLHPKKFVGLSLINLAGSHEQSRSFGRSDGFLPADGIGAICIKPMGAAQEDGDRIHAVIKSSYVNHKGRTNGSMSPSLNQCVDVVNSGLERAGIEPMSISFVEAAASGAALMDAIEFTALSKIFGDQTDEKHFCALGSMKLNFGHAESASGIGQLCKLVLQLKNRCIYATRPVGELNESIDLKHSPFYFPETNVSWSVSTSQVTGEALPRRGLVNSFGAGGTNASVVLEEPPEWANQATNTEQGKRHLVGLSAKSSNQLRQSAERLLEYVQQHAEISLADVSYTSLCGREAHAHRLVLMVDCLAELSTLLDGFATNPGIVDRRIFSGQEQNSNALHDLLNRQWAQKIFDEMLKSKDLDALGQYWVRGGEVPWSRIFEVGAGHFCAMPLYPFTRQKFIVNDTSLISPQIGVDLVTNSEAMQLSDAVDSSHLFSEQVGQILSVDNAAIRLDCSLSTMGVNSVSLQVVLAEFRQRTGIDLFRQRVTSSMTVAEIDQLCQTHVASQGDDVLSQTNPHRLDTAGRKKHPELVHLNQESVGQPVFWLHGGLGGVDVYKPIAEALSRPFYGIQARGWMTRRQPLRGIQSMAAYYVQIIRSVQPEGPYDLGGYSMGGLLAYEVTRQLQELGLQVNSVTMLDTMFHEDMHSIVMSKRDMYLQVINTFLAASVGVNQKGFENFLIHRDSVDFDLNDDKLFDSLLQQAAEKQSALPKNKLKRLALRCISVQQAYEALDYVPPDLPVPDQVKVNYIKNGSQKFYGDLEGYFSSQIGSHLMDEIDYWTFWLDKLPNMEFIEVDSTNHLSMLTESSSLQDIIKVCRDTYQLSTPYPSSERLAALPIS